MNNLANKNRTLFIHDNLPILRSMDSESVDLIATDPPFNKGVKAFTGITSAGIGVSYKDVWTWDDVQNEWLEQISDEHPKLKEVIEAAQAAHSPGMGAFICWLSVRVLAMHRVLKPTGSLYLHCDQTANSYIRLMLDAVFGSENRRNEIIWQRTSAHSNAGKFGTNTDSVLFYTKSNNAKWNPQHTAYSDKRLTDFRYEDDDGRKWASENISAKGLGGGYTYTYKGASNLWRCPPETMRRLDEEGRLHFTNRGGIRRKLYLDEMKGSAVQALWTDINCLGSNDKERTGYPTQKPIKLYQRIIRASSNENDIVLDPFAGCGTTCIAAESLGRQWIGIDLNIEAVDVIRESLGKQQLNQDFTVLHSPLIRTDNAVTAAPDLVLVSPKPQAVKIDMRAAKQQLIAEDGLHCQGCGYEPPKGLAEYLEVDHRIPKSKGGANTIRNMILLCRPCNGAKSNRMTLQDLRQLRVEQGRMLKNEWTAEWFAEQGRFA